MRPLFGCLAFGTCLLVLGFMLMPKWACGCATEADGPGESCMANLHQQSAALLEYAEDNDGQMVDRGRWMDAVLSRGVQEKAIHEPVPLDPAKGYAFNSKLSRRRLASLSGEEPMVFDSVAGVRNASDAGSSLPRPGRHDGKNNIAYLDGHVRREMNP